MLINVNFVQIAFTKASDLQESNPPVKSHCFWQFKFKSWLRVKKNVWKTGAYMETSGQGLFSRGLRQDIFRNWALLKSNTLRIKTSAIVSDQT